MGKLVLKSKHRLICGDATKPDEVEKLMNGEKPFLMVTDPPYGVEYDPTWRESQAMEGQARLAGPMPLQATGQVQNDDKKSWGEAFLLFPGDVAYVWHASWFIAEVSGDITKAGFGIRSLIIWNKQQGVFSRGHYHWQHEPCWYAVRDGKTARWCGDRKQTTVWDIMTASGWGRARMSEQDASTGHGTQKPVECMARPIRNHGAPGDVVYDPFCGSGTTIIACEQLNRRCLAVELDPKYCDVIVARYEKFTGTKAIRWEG